MSAKAAAGLAGVIAGLLLGGWAGLLAGLAGAGVLLWAAHSPGDGLLLLGPLARWELVRAARRQRVHLWRSLLGGWLLFVFLVLVKDLHAEGRSLRDADWLTERVLNGFGLGLFWIVAFFALATLPTVVAEEREANRLDHLLVTDLRDREIIVGKLAGRLAVLVGYVILPLPVLAMITSLCDVDPWYLVAPGVVALGCLAGFSGVAAAASASCRKVSYAVVTTVVVCGAILFALELADETSFLILRMSKRVRASLNSDTLDAILVVGRGLRFVGGGSPITASWRLDGVGQFGGKDDAVGPVLRNFLTVQLLVLAAGWWWACRRLRVPLVVAPRRGIRGLHTLPVTRPPVGDEPVYWYEATSPQSVLDRLADALYGSRWWVPAAVVGGAIGLLALAGGGPQAPDVQWRLQRIIPVSGPVLFCLVTIPVAWSACRSLARERERDTLDGLLLTGLTPGEIVYQKWKAAVLAPRGRYAVAAVLLLWGVCGGGSAVGAAAVVGTTAANAALAASLGLICSGYARTGNRAFVMLVVCGAAWAYGCGLLVYIGDSTRATIRYGSLVPAVPQVMAGFLKPGLTADDRLGQVVLYGGFVSAGAAVVALFVAVGRFAHQVRPKREEAE